MEKQLIDIICKTLREEAFSKEGAQRIGDDTAVIELGAHGAEEYLFSVDNLVEDVHFDTKLYKPFDIGWKAAAANISDIAAMAGIPLYMLVGLSLSRNITDKVNWVQNFYRGLNACSKQHGMPQVIGGDLTAADKTMVAVTVIGKAGPRGILRRVGTRFGAKVCVTGKWGNARSFLERVAVGEILNKKQQEIDHWLIREWERGQGSDIKYALKPSPRLREAHGIWNRNKDGVLIDSSDGLMASLYEIAEQNLVRVTIDPDLVPRDKHITEEQALYGGEEYELVGCFNEVPEGFTAIGKIEGGAIGVFDSGTGRKFDPARGFKHF